ncbi:MAG TPA: NUDIX hydrolase [Rhizomicrobium sp.]|nr:NUDIX hydrolase [Rhizomicrobium sp.]
MDHEKTGANIVLGVGAVVWNEREEVLLIRRRNPPRRNEWSMPGGKVEFGETLRAALAREVREETGLEIEIAGLIDVAELVRDARAGAEDAHYVLVDYCARARSGEPIAASDASEARWFSLAEIDALALWSETRRIIAESVRLRDRMSCPPAV